MFEEITCSILSSCNMDERPTKLREEYTKPNKYIKKITKYLQYKNPKKLQALQNPHSMQDVGSAQTSPSNIQRKEESKHKVWQTMASKSTISWLIFSNTTFKQQIRMEKYMGVELENKGLTKIESGSHKKRKEKNGDVWSKFE